MIHRSLSLRPVRTRGAVVAAVLALPLFAYGCSSRSEELAFSHARITSIAQCPDTGEKSITKVCVVDDHGEYYSPLGGDAAAPDLGMLLVPAGRALSIVYVFGEGYVPNASDVTSAAVRAYAAPLNVTNMDPTPGCCSEDSEANRVASTATLQGNTLTQRITDVPASGVQVATILDFATLYRTRLAAPCTLPDDACRFFAGSGAGGTPSGSGFVDRFYVGSVPASANGATPDSGH